ncbi:MAG TPA: zinc-binding dehydrogenase [Mycobacteriales bacterium]|nr:zinc-binding dehydrogenase [Mycobacteriales bacterium]
MGTQETSAVLMQAIRLHQVGQRPTLDEIPVPEPGPGEVRVAVRACGLCGSDVHILHGTTPTGPLPLVLGHEPSGIVDKLGEGVFGRSVGDRVCIAAGFGCDNCPACDAGRATVCPRLEIPGITRDGSQATYVVVPARTLISLPEQVDFATGAILMDAVSTPYHAIKKSGVTRGQTAVVFGLGGLGLHALTILSQVVGAHVIGVDRYPGALERALRFGADEVVDASGGKPANAVRLLTGGGVDHAFEFVGAAAVVDQAVKSLRPGGTCTVVGVTPEPLHLLPQALLVSNELRLQGSFGCSQDELVELVGLVAGGALDLTGTITHRFGLADFDSALQVLETKEGDPIRVVVEQP